MKNNAPTFAIIGKPQGGKSSIISALTFDDRIEVAPITGTTTFSKAYSYKYKHETICNFYDTPGFEQAKMLWIYIEKNKDENNYGNNILRSFIDSHHNEKIFKKDIEILKAILDSDFIVFVIDISENINIHAMGHQLEIIRYIKKQKIVLFNKIGNTDYSSSWRNLLEEYDLTNISEVNPLTSNFTNISKIYRSLYQINSTENEKQSLDYLISSNKEHIKENKRRSIQVISEMILEILQLEDKSVKIIGGITEKDKKNALEEYQNKIYTIEKNAKKEIAKIWGYHQVKIIDHREEIDSDENLKLGLTKKRLIALGVLGGAGSGAALGAPTVLADAGISTAIFTIIGGLSGAAATYFVSGKFNLMIISNQVIIHKIDKKAYNVSFILLKRSLEYLDRLIKHGHANRTEIIISKNSNELKFNSEWNFAKDEVKSIVEIHTSIVEDKKTKDSVNKLSIIIGNVIDREMK